MEPNAQTAPETPLTEGEVRQFVQELSAFRANLSSRSQDLLDALVMAASQDNSDVAGYDDNTRWIFPMGWVNDAQWVSLSRLCRSYGGVEVVLDPLNAGARVWGCRAP